jgi:hypothetical protein
MLSKDTEPNSQINKNAVFWKLAHFEPYCTDEYGHQILDYLVLDALSTYGTLLPASPSEIQEYIHDYYLTSFEETEILNICIDLQKKGLITCIDDRVSPKQKIFSINNEIYEKINQNLTTIKNLDQEIFDEWKSELLERYKIYDQIQRNINAIIENFKYFLSHLLVRHGVECVNLLYPESQKAHQWLQTVQIGIFDELPKINEFVDSIIKLEIPRFFLKNDSKRREYIFRQFNSSFFWHLIQIDENCSKLIREITAGQLLFLDNNVLYHLAGFNGPEVLRSAHTMLQLARELGYSLQVTTKTIEEYHESLSWQYRENSKHFPLPKELARIAVENLPYESFIVNYWKRQVEDNISLEDYVNEKSHIEDILSGLEINIWDKYRSDIEGSDELIYEESILSKVAPYFTNPLIIEHDAFHRVLINKIRGSRKYNFSEAQAWFLTSDSKLPAYDRVAKKGNNSLPFCLTIDQWIQINRPFLARTKNRKQYEESFQILVTQPFIRAMISNQAMDRAYQKVLSNLARYERMNPTLATRIITDASFMVSINKEEKEDVIVQKIESKFIDIAEQLSDEKSKSDDKVEETEKELKNEKELFNVEKQTLEKEKQSVEQSLSQRIEKKDKIILWLIFSFLSFILSYILWSSSILNNIIDNQRRILIIKIFTQILIILLLLLIPLWRKRKSILIPIIIDLCFWLLSLFA